MSDSDLKSAQSNVDARFRSMVILYGAMLVSVSTIVLLPVFIFRPTLNRGLSPLFCALIALAVLILGLSFWLRHKLLSRASEQQNPMIVQQAYIVSWALCEAVCLLGLVTYFVLDSPYYYYFFWVAGFTMIGYQPRRNDLQEASFKGRNHINE